VGQYVKSTLASRLTTARILGGISQRELCRLAGLAESTVGHLESGYHARADGETMVRIAAVLGVSTDYLLGRGKPLQTTDANKAFIQKCVAVVQDGAAKGWKLNAEGFWK
jgi:transcriptional regulator with XRE-family HTH domain